MTFEFGDRTFYFFADEGQWRKAALFIRVYLLQPVVLMAGGLFLALAVSHWLTHRRETAQRSALLTFAYLLVILSMSVLNRKTGAHVLRGFGYVLEGGSGFHESRIILEILDVFYFVPYGYFLTTGFRKWPVGLTLLTAFATGFAVELLQYLLGRGVGSVENWLAYCLGSLIGVGLGSWVIHWRRERAGKELGS